MPPDLLQAAIREASDGITKSANPNFKDHAAMLSTIHTIGSCDDVKKVGLCGASYHGKKAADVCPGACSAR